jgi:hypothetical protein
MREVLAVRELAVARTVSAQALVSFRGRKLRSSSSASPTVRPPLAEARGWDVDEHQADADDIEETSLRREIARTDPNMVTVGAGARAQASSDAAELADLNARPGKGAQELLAATSAAARPRSPARSSVRSEYQRRPAHGSLGRIGTPGPSRFCSSWQQMYDGPPTARGSAKSR